MWYRTAIDPEDAVNWHAVLEDPIVLEHDFLELKEICSHIGVGPATGCDGLFVQPATTVFPPAVSDFVYPTIAGKQLVLGQNSFQSTDVIFCSIPQETSKLAVESGVQITEALLAIDPERTKQRKHAIERNGTMDRWFKFKDSIDLTGYSVRRFWSKTSRKT